LDDDALMTIASSLGVSILKMTCCCFYKELSERLSVAAQDGEFRVAEAAREYTVWISKRNGH
jgi:hypothetical protein